MNAEQRKEIEEDCRNLVIAITQHGDHNQVEECVRLFAEDGTWLRGGQAYKGRAEIRKSYARGGTAVARHFNGGTLVNVVDDYHAEAVTYYLMFRYDPKVEDPQLPLPLEPPFSAGEWHDTFVKTAEGWRFQSRQTKRLFQRQGD